MAHKRLGKYFDVGNMHHSRKVCQQLVKEMCDALDLMGIRYHHPERTLLIALYDEESKEKIHEPNVLFSIRYGHRVLRPMGLARNTGKSTITGLIFDDYIDECELAERFRQGYLAKQAVEVEPRL